MMKCGSDTLVLLLLVFMLCFLLPGSSLDVDPNGYILYCPCMGRFGNQAEHFLGSLSFAHHFNRTLVLPPWVEYKPGHSKSVQIPFDKYFQVEPLKERAKVMTMEQFMRDLAPIIWPPHKRVVYCYSARQGGKTDDCNAKDGNPFGPFWDTFNIDFVKSEFFGPMSYDMAHPSVIDQWKKKYSAKSHLVLAFTGAPASFPVIETNVHNHKYMKWSNYIDTEARKFIKEHMHGKPFLGVHMRNGIDWTRACEHVQGSSSTNMFASANCLGYKMEHGKLTKDLCYPPDDIVIKQLKKAVKKLGVDFVFIATDDRDMIPQFQKAMKKITFVKMSNPEPHIDLAILGKAKHYIGNCVSTFSAFAARERKMKRKSVEYWAFSKKKHDEL